MYKFLLCLLLISCGTRKVNTDISKISEKSNKETNIEQHSSEKELVKNNSFQEVFFEKLRYNSTFQLIKEFDTSGNVTKETYTDSKTVDKENAHTTINNSTVRFLEKNNYMTIKVREVVTVTRYIKQKNTERNNNLIGVLIFVGAFVISYFIFKPPK